jgi:hypothetical protein
MDEGDIDLEYTPTITPISRPTPTTPEAALLTTLAEITGRMHVGPLHPADRAWLSDHAHDFQRLVNAMTTHDTPEAELAAALTDIHNRWNDECEGPDGWRPFGPFAAAALSRGASVG